jgi:glycine dehydrogenase
MKIGSFASRHIGPRASQVSDMLKATGNSSIEELIEKTIPSGIRMKEDLKISKALTEQEYLEHIGYMATQNVVFRNFIGLGYYPTVVPSVVLRNVLENPGWYTAYTPYQAEIAQGRLEALLNFQTMVSDLTAMEIANASLLDEGTAAGEAMIMLFNTRSREQSKNNVFKFFVDEDVYPQTISVLKTRAVPLGIELVFADFKSNPLGSDFFGSLVQYPSASGEVRDYKSFVEACNTKEIRVAVATDLMSLSLLTPPGEWGADVVFGNSQRFGVPMGYGGPHAAFFAAHESFKRHMPGRIIGVSKDRLGQVAYRMALQTREQHIRRDKATSNICTAQALLAVMASMYAVYHGAEGIKHTATFIHGAALQLIQGLKASHIGVEHDNVFDTVKCHPIKPQAEIKTLAEAKNINLHYPADGSVVIAMHEGLEYDDINDLLEVLGATGQVTEVIANDTDGLNGMKRTSAFLEHPVFNTYRSETEMMRYIKRLENKDLSLTHAMIPLGSCTMKLNAASELIPITMPEFSDLHPFCPIEQALGYHEILDELKRDLEEITGFAGISLQPNSGAQGEYAGLLVIRAYHHSRGDHHREICLIPSSAHGTNPASAVMAGMQVVVVKCDDNGNVDIQDLQQKAEKYKENLAAFMITYPSTHGVFESEIIEMNEIIHANGGQVYMDGANMNAQVGLTSPGRIGADVCHLNLHKTFAIPHGGGGPGMGPIGVAKHLAPFLPGNPIVLTGGEKAIEAVSSAPFGSALILLISYGYIKMLGTKGLQESTEMAILNANYIRAKLEGHYDILYKGKNGTVAHEMIVDCRAFKQSSGVEVADIAKRLIDYGFHAPTVSFPVAGTLMIEPTESESQEELDRFCEAMIAIRKEITEIENGTADATDNVIMQSPHTVEEACATEWNHSYSREKAVYPVEGLRTNKFWVPVARVDNAFGDRNLICTCPPLEQYDIELA